MEQHPRQNFSQRFKETQVSKTVLFWSCAGSVALAMLVGFSWGGWTTGGSAREMADKAAAQARQEVAAVVCVDRFMATSDAGVQLTALKEITSSYARTKFIQDGGWAIMPVSTTAGGETAMSGSSTDVRKAAGLCAEELIGREIPTTENAAQITEPVTVAQ